MRISAIILFFLVVWSCSSPNNSSLTEDNSTTLDTATTSTFVDSLNWIRIDDNFEYAFIDNQLSLADSLDFQIKGVGRINGQGQFFPFDSLSEYSFTKEQLFGIKLVDDVIKNNPNKTVYFKIKNDFIINQRKDLLENIFINPVDELTSEEFKELQTDLNDLDYIEQIEITKQANILKLGVNNTDSTVFVKLQVNQQNRNVDSLASKCNRLSKDKRIDNAFYNDLYEQTRGQYLIMKITHHNKS